VHQAAGVHNWIKEHPEQIRAEPLPTYSPNRDPGEYLNQDVKGVYWFSENWKIAFAGLARLLGLGRF
jgi:hypothetical protein